MFPASYASLTNHRLCNSLNIETSSRRVLCLIFEFDRTCGGVMKHGIPGSLPDAVQRARVPWLSIWSVALPGVLAILCIVIAGCDSHSSSRSNDSEAVTAEVAAAGSKQQQSSTAPAVLPATEFIDDSVRADDWLEDVTERTGIEFVHRNGRESGRFYLIESFGGGVAQIDYDQDGATDLYFTGGGQISADPQPPSVRGLAAGVYRNRREWQFTSATAMAGLSDPADYSLGCTVTDYNSDGFPDLFLYCYGRSRLYRNEGDGTFTEGATSEQLPAIGMTTAAAWADIDRDSLPDLFLARYVAWSPATDVECHNVLKVRDLCGPNQYDETTAQVWHNRGDGGFENWSEKVGLKVGVKGLGLVAGDFNDDGWIDFYLANDETANHLYWGTSDFTLREAGWESGVAAGEAGLEEGSMGTDVGDIDGDGRPELWVANFENEDNSLYRNLGSEQFRHATVPFGLAGASRMNVGWGTSLTDFDSDGWLDILVLNGNAVYYSPHSTFEQVPQLFQNQAGQRFVEVTQHGGSYFRQKHAARGAAVGDLDEDGAIDIVVSHLNEPVRVLRNRKIPANWLRISLTGTSGARQPIGARVTLADAPHELTRFVVSGAGYASHCDQRITFPLAAGRNSASVTVRWPGRGEETFRELAVRQDHVLIEGRGVPNERR